VHGERRALSEPTDTKSTVAQLDPITPLQAKRIIDEHYETFP
jgi:hypothetical protein